MKTTACPWCRQPVLDFSNNPNFVRNLEEKKESKDSKERKIPEARRCTKCGVCLWKYDRWCNNCGSPQ